MVKYFLIFLINQLLFFHSLEMHDLIILIFIFESFHDCFGIFHECFFERCRYNVGFVFIGFLVSLLCASGNFHIRILTFGMNLLKVGWSM